MAQAAEIIDLDSFRQRQLAARMEEASPSAQPCPPSFAMPAIIWMPVWVMVPMWPATA